MKRQSYKRPGWDCIRNPCGKNGCGTNPGSSHGIHGDDWVYVVSDGPFALSLTVFSHQFPATVPPETVRRLADAGPFGADLSLHVGLPVEDGRARDCEYVEGGKCYQGHRWSSVSAADEFWLDSARPGDSFDQSEGFWRALEQRFEEWRADARQEIADRSPATTAEMLAKAVLAGDAGAADALCDWWMEYRSGRASQ